jgi:hypothetical protein
VIPYVVDDRDRVVEAAGFPLPAGGAPLPMVVADEHRLLLAYRTEVVDPAWDGSRVVSVGPSSAGRIAVVRAGGFDLHWGWPNEDVLAAHPLAGRGIQPDGVYEVIESSWVRAMEKGNAIHPQHTPALFEARRHLLFAFHDSTLELLVSRVVAEVVEGPLERVVALLAGELHRSS